MKRRKLVVSAFLPMMMISWVLMLGEAPMRQLANDFISFRVKPIDGCMGGNCRRWAKVYDGDNVLKTTVRVKAVNEQDVKLRHM